MYIEHLDEIEPGIYEDPFATEPNTIEIENHYESNALKILSDDLGHYCLLQRYLRESRSSLLAKPFNKVCDIAGGHPKLASLLKINEIDVYDEFAEMYESLNNQFLRLYQVNSKVNYIPFDIINGKYNDCYDLAIFCHILEHLTIDQIRLVLFSINANEAIVYGPNVSRAQNKNWFHFAPADHRTFLTRKAMEHQLISAGFHIVESFDFHEDYFVYGKRH